MKKTAKWPDLWVCQFCAKESKASKWVKGKCPKCGKKYNWLLAQDSEE